MIPLKAMIGQLGVIRTLQRTRKVLFGRYLLLTNIGISVSLSSTGDILQQHYQILKNDKGEWDRTRTAHMATSGGTVGIFCHYWYNWLDKWLPGRTFKIVAKKVLVDQVFFSPIYISVFFITVGLLERSSFSRVKEEIFHKGGQLYLAEWIVWPVAQVVNFYWLPTKYRVLYDNTISLGFDVFTSYVKHGVELPSEKTEETVSEEVKATDVEECESN